MIKKTLEAAIGNFVALRYQGAISVGTLSKDVFDQDTYIVSDGINKNAFNADYVAGISIAASSPMVITVK